MKQENEISKVKLENSYLSLPKNLYTKISPSEVTKPNLVAFNNSFANELDVPFSEFDYEELVQFFAGNLLAEGSEPIALAYAGHQFGGFTILGDGRAHLLGEVRSKNGDLLDIQLKGSGKTPYGRRGDGKAALGPMLREYIISEAMHNLGIRTTRSLAVVTTGEEVKRETSLQGAILARTASSHIRFGTFELLADQNDKDGLKKLADYVIQRHYPELKEADEPYIELLKAVMGQHISLVVSWLKVGFIHGVMNTDNMSISGETIDYGPCAFMDEYHPRTVFSAIDRRGRYSYANQPHIAQWNIARLAESILPLLDDDLNGSADKADEVISSYYSLFQDEWLLMMRKKMGIIDAAKEDEELIGDLLKCMQMHQLDYTNTFRYLTMEEMPSEGNYHSDDFKAWIAKWKKRVQKDGRSLDEAISIMRSNNPAFIPRNHLVEEALNSAQQSNDFRKFNKLLDVLKNPYSENEDNSDYQKPPSEEQRVHQTFCGT